MNQALRPALASFLIAGLVVGCGRNEGAQPQAAPVADAKSAPGNDAPGPNPPKGIPQPGPGKASDSEDAEFRRRLNQRSWRLYTDTRIGDRKRLVYLSLRQPAEDDDYKMIARSKTLQVLDLRDAACTDKGLTAVSGIPQMEGIIVDGERVTDAGIKALARSQSLDNVMLFGTKKVTDAGVKELAALPRLQTLHLYFFSLDGSAFEALAGSKTLTSVNLQYMDGLTDAGVAHLGRIPNLNELKIGGVFGKRTLTSAGIKALVDARLPPRFEFDVKLIDDDLLAALVAKNWFLGSATPERVTVIDLDYSKVTDRGFATLLTCTNTTMMNLRNTGVTDTTLVRLGGFKKLNWLSLGGTKVTASGLDAVAGLPIRHLALEGCELTEEAFRAIGKMAALEELWLSDAKMKAGWLKHIATLPKLKDLNLMRASFDDAAVPHLVTMPSLTNVTLNNTALGDAGFQELVKLPKLTVLWVDGTKVTKDAYKKAKQDYPKLGLLHNSYDQ